MIVLLRNIIFAFLVPSFLMVGCMPIKPGSVRSNDKLYETFYVGEKGTQYFVKPLGFKGGDKPLKMDMSFRYNDDISEMATINFSLLNDEKINKIDSLALSNNDAKVVMDNVDLMFNEKQKDWVLSRFSTQSSISQLVKVFKNGNWIVKVYQGGKERVFYAKKRTGRKIEKINNMVFTLIEG